MDDRDLRKPKDEVDDEDKLRDNCRAPCLDREDEKGEVQHRQQHLAEEQRRGGRLVGAVLHLKRRDPEPLAVNDAESAQDEPEDGALIPMRPLLGAVDQVVHAEDHPRTLR